MSNHIRRLITIVAVTLAAICFGAPAGIPASPAIAQGGWYAEYFANASLSGAPALTRYDDTLHFEWGAGSPGSGIPDDNFSARWTHDDWFEGGVYRFSYRSDDGVRIWVGDALVVDDWRDRQANWTYVDHHIPRGDHSVRVEYFEHTGGAAIHVAWERTGSGEVWRGEYYDNKDLSGSSILVRYDPAIDFDWGSGSPDSSISGNYFSVRWTRTLGFSPGVYRFYASCDDGVRIFVDGNRVVNAWKDQKLPNTQSGDVTLGNGQHTVVVEYYEHSGGAHAHVWWDRLDSFSGWEGRYYANTELRGGPALVRDDAEINFDWGESAPADWMPTDSFSVVWTRNVYFAPGYYRFNVQSDDGVRVWLDGGIIMDFWRPMDYEWHYRDDTYLEGTHALKVEYFEGAGGARIHFWWDQRGVAPPPPAPAPTTPDDQGARGPWEASYYDNADLSGSPVLTRQDEALDFNWGWGSPDPAAPSSNFSAVWTRAVEFGGGRYTFTTTSDDGVRLYVDEQLVIDSWRPMRGTRSATLNLSEGTHTVRLEYFERFGVALVRLTWRRW
jgi:hypothetical protein